MFRIVCMALAVLLPFCVARANESSLPPNRELEPLPLYAQVGSRVAKFLPSRHLTRSLLDDAISRRAWSNYLSSLDFEHVYFLKSDIDRFRSRERQLDDDLSEGNLEFAYEVFEVFKNRVANRHAYIGDRLDQGFDFEKEETYTPRRRTTPWPRHEQEWDEIWRKKIKNEYLRQIIGKEFGGDEDEPRDDEGPAPSTNTLETPPETGVPHAADGTHDGPASPPPPSPEEIVLKRYTQLLTVLRDSDAEWVLQKYMSAFANAYDPHSQYLTPSAHEDFEIEMKLSLVGIGALLRAEDGAATIVHLIPGGPADRDTSKNRLQPGDKIIAVGQGNEEPVDILHRPLNKIVRLIRGEKGSTVTLVIIPASDPTESTTRTVRIVRDEVKLEEQAASQDVRTVKTGDGSLRRLGRVTLPAFYANLDARSQDDPGFRSASYDVARAMHVLQTNGVEGILLDLRNNGGGSLLEAVRMTGLFIPTGPTVMVRDGRTVRVLPDSDPRVAYNGPLVILVNRLSASASEIVAGALQDYDRAIIVGDSKTHGKGTVQTILQLGLDPRLGSVKLTTASYYRISGASTQLRGIQPDIIIPSPYDFMEIGEEHLPNPIPWSTVRQASYSPVANLEAPIALLRAASEARRKDDERYRAYEQLLQRIKTLSENREVPLHLEKRRAMAAAERELADLQKALTPMDEETPDKEDDVDVVLDEAFQILADFVEFEQATLRGEPVDAVTNNKKSWPQLIEEMLKNL